MRIDKAKVRYIDCIKSEIKKKSNSRISTYTEDFKSEYYNIKIEKLIPFANQARMHFDQESLHFLAQTIKEHGIRQPLTVIPSEVKKGFYEIVSGDRRYRAAKILEMFTIPCIIIHNKESAEEIAIIENIQRKDLHPVELMKAYRKLLDNNVCTSYNDIAKKVGVTKSSVVENMNLHNLSEEARILLVEKNIKTRDFLRKLCQLDKLKQLELINQFLLIKKGNLRIKNSSCIEAKYKILDIRLNNNEYFKIGVNKINQLTDIQKRRCMKLLQKILREIE